MIFVVFFVVHLYHHVSLLNSVKISKEIKLKIFISIFLAFLPPEPTYSLLVADNPTPINATNDPTTSAAATKLPGDSLRYKIFFSDKAEWQHSSNEISKLEPYFVTTARHNRIACVYINCIPNPKYYILFSHGNAVDLGKHISVSSTVKVEIPPKIQNFYVIESRFTPPEL